jgi:phosphohistidine phosphatase SixA
MISLCAALISSFLILASPGVAAPQATETYYVMRHLHTPEGITDPDLTEEGHRHAHLLADRFKQGEIDVIYVNSTKRTQQTAAPLAAKLGITPKFYDPRDTPALIAAVKAEAGTVLVVGHSNTVPDITAALGSVRVGPLEHKDFGTLWKIRNSPDGGSSMTFWQIGSSGE